MTARQVLSKLWLDAGLPSTSLESITLTGKSDFVPSTFLIAEAAQASIGASALAASQILSLRRCSDSDSDGGGEGGGGGGASTTIPPPVQVDAEDAFTEFRCEQVSTMNGQVPKAWDNLAGIYRTKDINNNGFVRPHTNWEHHKRGFLQLIGLPFDATKEDVTRTLRNNFEADALAESAMKKGLVVTANRTFSEWDQHPQGAIAALRFLKEGKGPISVTRLNERPLKPFHGGRREAKLPLSGVRVLDLTRVIAGPTAGRTLANYGADVIWVTAPQNPSLPNLDFDTSRGKRTVQLDLRRSSQNDRELFISLIKEADVLLQAYRPNGLAQLGFSLEEVVELNPDIVYASLSAWGTEGPWKDRKGFDSLVQFATGIDDAEGRAYCLSQEQPSPFVPRALPCQALDHCSGYLLSFGIQAALYKRAIEGGGAYKVENSLLSTATWLRSLGRTTDQNKSALQTLFTKNLPLPNVDQVREKGRLERIVREDGSVIECVKHSAFIDGLELDRTLRAPVGLNCDEPRWLDRD